MPFLGTQPAETALTTGDLGADIVTNAKIADDQIDSEHYVNGSIDTAHIAANAIDGTLTKDALIADYSDVTITASDLIMYGDATDSNNTKRDTVQGVLDLVGGSALTLIEYQDITSAASSIDFNDLGTAVNSYTLRISDMDVSSAGAALWIRFSQDNGSSWKTTSTYFPHSRFIDTSHGEVNAGGTNQTEIVIATNCGNGTYWGGEFNFTREDSDNSSWSFMGGYYENSTPYVNFARGGGATSGCSDIDAIQILASTGNVLGEAALYKWTES
jgi:hypothetical protein